MNLSKRLADALRESLRYHETRLEDLREEDENDAETKRAAAAYEESLAALHVFDTYVIDCEEDGPWQVFQTDDGKASIGRDPEDPFARGFGYADACRIVALHNLSVDRIRARKVISW